VKINSIVIVGGGSSGWFTASALSKHCPEIDVTLIESPDVPTIGVGESTLGHINPFFKSLGMKDEDWMPHCNATYKASIKFTDFHVRGESFHYTFGFEDMTNTIYGKDDWFFKKWMYPETSWEDFTRSYTAQMPLIENNKIYMGDKIPSYKPERDVAYHMDATLLGNWMRDNLCDITHVKENIVRVVLDDKGSIENLVTDNENTYSADLFIDCSGFNSILLDGEFNESFKSYSDELINNKAWATHMPYTNKNEQMEPFTNCTAIENGWVWNIPLWDSIGTGYVFSDKFVDDNQALQEFQKHIGQGNELDYKLVDIKCGRHERCWVKNCIAIGLSNGFIEPLESTGLFLVHETINKLIISLQKDSGYVNQFTRDSLNREVGIQTDSLKYFLVYHFIDSQRDDTKYWRWYTQELEMSDYFFPNDGEAHAIGGGLWEEVNLAGIRSGRLNEFLTDLSRIQLQYHTFNNANLGLQCIAVGHHNGIYTDYIRSSMSEVDKENLQKTFNYWDKRNKEITEFSKHCPTMYEYLKENIH
jgi:flavin-dependent dehydrogenase